MDITIHVDITLIILNVHVVNVILKWVIGKAASEFLEGQRGKCATIGVHEASPGVFWVVHVGVDRLDAHNRGCFTRKGEG